MDVSAALELLSVRFPDTFAAYDGESAEAFLDRLRFPPAARHLALEVFARSFFAHPSEFSAGELVAMFHTYFLGSAEGLLFDVPTDDYDAALWAPAGSLPARAGRRGQDGGERRAPDLPGGRCRGAALGSGAIVRADACVLAADPATTRHLGSTCEFVAHDDPSGHTSWRERLAATRTAPPFAVWRLWLDRPVRTDRPPFLGTSGFGPLDNVSVLELFEDGAADWRRRTGGSVVELHAYALPYGREDDAGQTRTKEQLRAELTRVYPETAAAQVVEEEWLVRDDCPLVGTGPWHLRPGVVTPDPRLVLAGDGVRCDFPVALMERAATTGFQAANALLGTLGGGRARSLDRADGRASPGRSGRRRAPSLIRPTPQEGGSTAFQAIALLELKPELALTVATPPAAGRIRSADMAVSMPLPDPAVVARCT